MNEKEYKKKINYEKKFYNPNLYNEQLVEKTNDALRWVLDKVQERVQEKTGNRVLEYVVDLVNKKFQRNSKPIRILSIGSGPGGGEIFMAKQFVGEYVMDCLDINEQSIKMGQQKSDELKLNLKFMQSDINHLELPEDHYDVVYAGAALHHLINLEHIASEIKKSLKNDGRFVVYDGIARNGLRLWPETKKIANKLFLLLPKQFRANHTIEPLSKFRINSELPDIDVSKDGFECIRSEELYPILANEFIIEVEVFGFSFARRFVDNEFGSNYDLTNPFHKTILELIIKLDKEYTNQYDLKPESVFLVLKK